MNDVVLIDANLIVLLIVGAASTELIKRHKKLTDYSSDDFELVTMLVGEYSDILTLPHVLAEASNLCRFSGSWAHRSVQAAFTSFVEGAIELPVSSLAGCRRGEFDRVGLADAVILHACTLDIPEIRPTLLTADTPLADAALSLGCSVIDYTRHYQSG